MQTNDMKSFVQTACIREIAATKDHPLDLSEIPPLPSASFQPNFTDIAHISDYSADEALFAWVRKWRSRDTVKTAQYYLGALLCVFKKEDRILLRATASDHEHFLPLTIKRTEDVQPICALLRCMANLIIDAVMRCTGPYFYGDGICYNLTLAIRYADKINAQWTDLPQSKRRRLERTFCVVTKQRDGADGTYKGVVVWYLPYERGGVYPKLKSLTTFGDECYFIANKKLEGYYPLFEDLLDRTRDDYDDSGDAIELEGEID